MSRNVASIVTPVVDLTVYVYEPLVGVTFVPFIFNSLNFPMVVADTVIVMLESYATFVPVAIVVPEAFLTVTVPIFSESDEA